MPVHDGYMHPCTYPITCLGVFSTIKSRVILVALFFHLSALSMTELRRAAASLRLSNSG